MNLVSEFLQWLSQYSWLLRHEDLQGLLRYAAGIATVVFSSITFLIKLNEKREHTSAQLAVAATSWDARTGFPISPLQTKTRLAPIMHIPADLSRRTKGVKGWFTITEVRVWNAGQDPLWGSAFNRSVAVDVAIDEGVGDWALRGCLSSDASARVHLGRVVHSASGQRIPIRFDILRPGKGILVQIWHNSEDGSKIRINAIADQASTTLVGVHHAIKRRIVERMNTAVLWLVLPAAVLTVHFMNSHSTIAAVVSGAFTWMLILSAYLHWRMKPLAPEDLGFSNANARVLFYHGPG